MQGQGEANQPQSQLQTVEKHSDNQDNRQNHFVIFSGLMEQDKQFKFNYI